MLHHTHPISILIAESFSCQRDLIVNLKNSALAPHLRVYASHSQNRHEILSNADVNLAPSPLGETAIDWTIEQCKQHQIKWVFVGKYCELYQKHVAQFAANGIHLITGATSLTTHQQLDDKYLFTQICQQHGLAVTPAYYFANASQLDQAYQQAQHDFPQYRLCAKPVKGVFGYGFVRFHDQASFNGLFHHPLEIPFTLFSEKYKALSQPPAYILMPYLAGQECSVDIACDQGAIISMATRIKEQSRQKISLKGDCDDICHQLVKIFGLDGLINIQFKQDENGVWHILEINARPAGGFGYSIHTGQNLIADLFSHKLNIPMGSSLAQQQIYVFPFTSSLSQEV